MPRRRVMLPVLRLDRALFNRVARRHTPWLDGLMPAATRAANYSRLWLVIAAVLALAGGRRGRRAALRGVGSIALTSPIVNLVIKRLVRRPRPSLRHVPAARRLRTQPLTTSFPSGHAASAAAFAAGASAELPRAAVPLGVLAGVVAYSRIYVGVHYPLDVVTGATLGAGGALLTRLQWPAPHAPRTPAPGERSATLFYDAGCGLCRWTAAKVAAWDRRGAVRLVPLQDRSEADRLLGSMDERSRMASWHLVTADARVWSAGGGVAPLLRLLPGGGPIARLASALRPLTARGYDLVAAHRTALGRLLPRRARERADSRLRSDEG